MRKKGVMRRAGGYSLFGAITPWISKKQKRSEFGPTPSDRQATRLSDPRETTNNSIGPTGREGSEGGKLRNGRGGQGDGPTPSGREARMSQPQLTDLAISSQTV